MAKGTIKTFISQKGYGFIEQSGKPDIFFHVSAWYGQGEPQIGQAVSYTAGVGREGKPAARNVAPSGEKRHEVSAKSPKSKETNSSMGNRFLNPYNFVRYLPTRTIGEDADTDVRLMGRTEPAPHDRWMGLSGQITCQIQTITPLFISSAEGVKEEKGLESKEHLNYQFFRIGGKKTIPASTLRGCVRSVFEAVTNSPFSNLADKRLSYRLSSSEMRKLIPGRLEKQKDGSWCVRLLPGYADFLPAQEQRRLYASPVSMYDPVARNHEHGQPPLKIDRAKEWQHRKLYWAVLRAGSLGWRALALTKSEKEAISKMNEIKQHTKKELRIQSGFLCRTNQNTINKHSERFFYYDISRKDVPDPLPITPEIIREYLDLIRDYQSRHADNVAKGVGPEPKRGRNLEFSRFVYEQKEGEEIADGELVYVYLAESEGDLWVHFLAPVSWPRVAYKHTIAELLPSDMHKSENSNLLDPASRVFGWVHGDGQKEDGGYAGRVKFSSALLQGEENNLEEKTLAILGSPKPTTTRFYLVDQKTGRPQNGRSDKDAGYDGNNKLRGRKFYRHFLPQKEYLTSDDPTDQNRTIRDAEREGSIFRFNITFENLAPVELGALLWSLTLDGKAYHKLGYGKPLGLGSVEITTENVTLYHQANRYQSLTNSGERELPTSQQNDLVTRFQKALRYYYAANQEILTMIEKHGVPMSEIAFEDLPNVADILALLSKQPPEIPVHYPYSLDPNSNGSFEWFVGNTNTNGPKLELELANGSNGLPFLTKNAGKPKKKQKH